MHVRKIKYIICFSPNCVCVCIFLIKIFFAHENYMGKVQERLDLFRSFFFPYQRTISY